MEWTAVLDQSDVDDLMRTAAHFHDWYLAGFRYDPLARTAHDDKNLARFISETDALNVVFRDGSKDKAGNWPELEIEFHDIADMRYMNGTQPDPFFECVLEDTRRGWVFASGGPLTPEERDNPHIIDASFFVRAGTVRWRKLGGTADVESPQR